MLDYESIFLVFHCNFHRIMHSFLFNKLLSNTKDVKLCMWSVTESTILTRSSKNAWTNNLPKTHQKEIEKWARN